VECEHAQQVVADVVMLRDMAAGRFDEQRVRQTAEVLPHLVSRFIKVCGFVPMLGAGEHRERTLWLRDLQIAVRFDDNWPADPDLLNRALETIMAPDRFLSETNAGLLAADGCLVRGDDRSARVIRHASCGWRGPGLVLPAHRKH
jgi:hypothetical protein